MQLGLGGLSIRRQNRLPVLAFVALLLLCERTSAQVDVDLHTGVFLEPSSTSDVSVINPAVRIQATPLDALSIHASYEADIVSGASESVKAGPVTGVDVVSSATRFSDTRHVAGGGLTLRRRTTSLTASYSYGTENDYRSHGLSVSSATEFFQHNTKLEMAYARGFDRVCTTEFDATIAPSARQALDSADGCFTQAENRATRKLNQDNFQGAWTQAWTPVLATQVVLTAVLQNGFLANPYRNVVISPSGGSALENHPENRARGALSLRVRYYLRPIKTTFGLGARAYRDTWDILSQTYELHVERHLVPWLRILVRGRYYSQSEALFYSDDYTGGEPLTGPRGQYWTGDRELSSLNSFSVGGRALSTFQSGTQGKVLGAFDELGAFLGVEVIQTDLKNFTWGGEEPDDQTAYLVSLGINAKL